MAGFWWEEETERRDVRVHTRALVTEHLPRGRFFFINLLSDFHQEGAMIHREIGFYTLEHVGGAYVREVRSPNVFKKLSVITELALFSVEVRNLLQIPLTHTLCDTGFNEIHNDMYLRNACLRQG